MTRSWGIILLAVYLLIVALVSLTNVRFVALDVIEGCLAAGAGLCLLLGK